MLRLKNNTGATSLIGRVVVLDPNDSGAFIYAGTSSTNAIGVITNSVPFRSIANIATSGEKAKVSVTEQINEGDTVRLRISSDGGSSATCRKLRTTDGTVLAIGSALQRGNKDVLCLINIKSIAGSSVSSTTESFETVSKNLKAYDSVLTYNGSDLDYITYDLGGGRTIVKTLNYTLGVLTSIVLSGDTPGGVDLTKTLSYTGTDLTGVVYS